jgi:hypothetical protein
MMADSRDSKRRRMRRHKLKEKTRVPRGGFFIEEERNDQGMDLEFSIKELKLRTPSTADR